MTNIKKGIKSNKLEKYSDLFIDSINKAVETLQALLKVKSLEIDFNLEDYLFDYMEIDDWDKEKFGTKAKNKGINLFSLGYDLVIFGNFPEGMNNGTLATSYPYILNSKTGQPVIGVFSINKNVDYSLKNSKEYFQSIIFHEFTHILGFNSDHFDNYLHILLKKDNIYYINSTRVIQVAK